MLVLFKTFFIVHGNNNTMVSLIVLKRFRCILHYIKKSKKVTFLMSTDTY